MINWDATPEENTLITAIANRAVAMAKKAGIEYEFLDAAMDVCGVHCNACRLDLKKLLEFDDANFGHDVFGMRRYIDRKSAELTQGFLPRCSADDREVTSG